MCVYIYVYGFKAGRVKFHVSFVLFAFNMKGNIANFFHSVIMKNIFFFY